MQLGNFIISLLEMPTTKEPEQQVAANTSSNNEPEQQVVLVTDGDSCKTMNDSTSTLGGFWCLKGTKQWSLKYDEDEETMNDDSSWNDDEVEDILVFEESSAILGEAPQRTVGFTNVEIRNYNVVMGNHPFCDDGLALTLDWKYNPDSTVMSVQEHQQQGPKRELKRLSYAERKRRLGEMALFALEQEYAQSEQAGDCQPARTSNQEEEQTPAAAATVATPVNSLWTSQSSMDHLLDGVIGDDEDDDDSDDDLPPPDLEPLSFMSQAAGRRQRRGKAKKGTKIKVTM